MPPLPQLAKNKLLIIYKLLSDLLFLLLLFFALALVVDGLIPGIVSTHISFLKIICFIAGNLIALYAVGYLAQITMTSGVSGRLARSDTKRLRACGRRSRRRTMDASRAAQGSSKNRPASSSYNASSRLARRSSASRRGARQACDQSGRCQERQPQSFSQRPSP